MSEATATTSAPFAQSRPAASAAKPVEGVSKSNATLRLAGRIGAMNQVGQTQDGFPIVETILLLPAADVYSHPRRFCVTSQSKLGREGEDVTIDVEVQCRPWRDSKGRWHYPHYLWAL